MRGECLELKKKLKKDKFTFKKAKAMLATWSDEDEDDHSQATSGDEDVHCLMARSEDSNEPFLMSSRPSKRLASRRHPSSSRAGNDGAEDERMTKHRDDRLPELVVPPRLHLTHSKGTHTKFVQQRYVEFESSAIMFPNLQPLFDSQGWTPFLYHHKRYSPSAVRDFYNNLGYTPDNRFFTTGRVEELLVAEELWNDHKKPFFFPFSSAATCTNHSLEVDQR
ncbi:hypothetical protein Taro_042468 [Colocasia esculenta]|uniref:Uncharacterized protein n=1 Tax=Colocasia esculenta TaxID=4460 RepID=A0A843WE25_COLES|nr:hypothetical protein [Colocasia esculenta]